jgi:predicted DNA-binding protein with PD1-like motif
LCGFCKCSHIIEYAALSKTPHAWADSLMLVFQHLAWKRRVVHVTPRNFSKQEGGRIVSASYQQGSVSRVMMIRLHPGQDLIEGIAEACLTHGLKSGVITSCIGSLQRASFFTVVPLPNKIGAGYGDPVVKEGPLELVSAQGTIGQDLEGKLLIHMHGALADSRGNVFGGHLIKGKCPVLVTCEAMIAFLEGVHAVQRPDPEAEMNLLTFVK